MWMCEWKWNYNGWTVTQNVSAQIYSSDPIKFCSFFLWCNQILEKCVTIRKKNVMAFFYTIYIESEHLLLWLLVELSQYLSCGHNLRLKSGDKLHLRKWHCDINVLVWDETIYECWPIYTLLELGLFSNIFFFFLEATSSCIIFVFDEKKTLWPTQNLEGLQNFPVCVCIFWTQMMWLT